MKTVSHFLARLTFAVLISALPVFAANHVVHMTSLYEFAPDYLEIQVGDTVTWHNDDDTESLGARSDTGFIWDTGGVETNGDSEPVPFTTVGTFPYYDPTYFPLGMTGTIVVSSGGSSSPSVDCTGVLSFDFNTWIASGVDPALTQGTEVHAQFWSRDPGLPPPSVVLSNALNFQIAL